MSWAQSFTIMKANLYQNINRNFAFKGYLNGGNPLKEKKRFVSICNSGNLGYHM